MLASHINKCVFRWSLNLYNIFEISPRCDTWLVCLWIPCLEHINEIKSWTDQDKSLRRPGFCTSDAECLLISFNLIVLSHKSSFLPQTILFGCVLDSETGPFDLTLHLDCPNTIFWYDLSAWGRDNLCEHVVTSHIDKQSALKPLSPESNRQESHPWFWSSLKSLFLLLLSCKIFPELLRYRSSDVGEKSLKHIQFFR